MRSRLSAIAVVLSLAACGGPSSEDVLTQQKLDESRSAPELPEVALSDNPEPEPAPAVNEEAPVENELGNLLEGNLMSPGDEGEQSGTSPIPAAFRGRWGMTVEDCMEPRRPGSMALDVSARSLSLSDGEGHLYRTLGDFPERYVGIFNYNGDRGRWSATEELALTGSSKVLIRQVDGGTLRYRRCTRTGG